MEDIVATKADIETAEKVIKPINNELPLPEELQHLGEDDLHKLEKSLTRRLDCSLMPM